MQLYYASASPFARKVMVTLHETGQLDDVELLTATAPRWMQPTCPPPITRWANCQP